ncbi:PREDICTED: adhesion G-protein coupled receptor G6-like [Amphimedon queenslandica]|uniref:G-protein coupled receptors family 2 profile 2 domain-containing protein n=1 Tax=Amphimedon queenslandica TaxID=400682 RepID=A0AAN0JHS6_AMPQE|nr:PREDICTED: adhesion G-protein coupled receptor G6-like [Amphimedon queenslandica]|eukprot:XP_019856351.1 PREDICTED: adhesion G-protein coupled receptor G6-like [Amphimedon queenslandica]
MRLVNISFTNISVSDTGTYQLTVKNLAGEDTVDNISLNVKALPLIFTSSRSILLNESESTLLECKADGLPPPSITWLANRRQIGGLSSTFTITTVATDSVRQDVPTFTSRLNATDLLPTHNGSYECVVENQEGTARIQYNISVIPKNFCVSNPCRNGGTCSSGTSSYRCFCTEQWTGKNCDKPATPPAEPYFFASYNRTFYHEFGSTVLLSCPVTGYPQPNIIWFKDDVLLVGAITEDYEIKKLDLNTRGIYRCEATNELGSIKSDNMTVKIKGLVQYLITVKFSKEFIDNFFGHETRRRRQDDDDTYKATEERLNALIGRVESDLMVLLKENNSLVFEFVSMVHHGIATSLLQPIQLLLTILSDTGGSDLLKSIVEDSFNKLKQKLAMAFETDGNPFSSTVARFDGCTPATTVIPSPNGDPNLDFAFPWPETDLSQLITLRCPCGPEGFDIGVIRNATRKCGGNFENGAVWESPIDEACNFSTSARELCALASLEEPVEVLTGLDNITASTEDIGSLELSISTVFVENLTTIVRGDRTFTETFLTVTDNLLSINENAIIESNEEARTSGRLLQSFEGVVDDIPVKSTDKNTIILRTKFAVTVQELNTNSFDDDDSLIFSVTNNTKNFSSANSVSFSDDLNDPSGQIVIPGSILMNVTLNSTVRLTQTAFDTDALFLRRNSLLMKYSYLQVGSILVSASFVDYNISNQEDLINITMKKDKIHHINAICSYWNYTADDYYGNWSNYGCSVLYEDSDIVICGCNHLTTFALLLDVSPEDDPNRPPPFTEFATALTFIGCAVSILCLVLIILTYSIEKRLRNTNNGKLLINMSCALVGLYVSFIPASYAAPIEELCVVVGAFLHYFSLATFLSMASEATILYVELVKVFASGKGNMIMKAILVTWVTPFFLVVLTLAPDYKNYVYDRLCRPKDWQYWIGYIGPFSVIYIYNWIMFLIIIISLSKQQCKMKSQTGNANLGSTTAKQLMLMITLSVLFGLGWGLGLASTSKFPIQWLRYSFEVAFIIAVTFQGLFIFILYGIKVVKVRKTWLKWFYLVTVQREKAQKVEYSLKSTSYSMRQSSKKLKAMTYSLGTYDSGNVELKKVNHQSQFNSMSPSPEPADKPAITDSTVKKLLILEEGKLKTEKLANGCKSEDLDNKSGQA